MTKPRHRKFLVLLVLLGLLILVGVAQENAFAGLATADPPHSPAYQGIDNASCLGCHSAPGQQIALPSGDPLYISVDENIYHASVHGTQGYLCIQCHTDKNVFPHPPITAQTRREYSIQQAQICANCHQEKLRETMNGVHQKALQAGKLEAAVCTDCHGAHSVQPLDEPRSRIPQTCERCHSQIFALYKDSVHGAALLGEGNPDVPSCTDCHGVHNVQGPSTTGFHLFSPDICARCHADEELMAKYSINTDVFDTYLSDFHGTTVELFQTVAPGQETNKPVCIDCHGVHNILRADDPNSSVMKENILATCQRCHPDATTNFPNSWLSHYRPSPEHSPIVYYVQVFYRIFIPTVLGGMLLFVLADSGRRFFRRNKETRHE